MIFSKEIRKKYIGFDDVWMIILGVPALSILMILLFKGGPSRFADEDFFKSLFHSTLITGSYWLANRWMIVQIRKYYRTFSSARKRIILQVIISVMISFIIGPVTFYILKYIGNTLQIEWLMGHKPRPMMLQTIVITLLMIFIYEVIYFYHQLRHSILEKEAFKQAHIQSQWEGLRNQVNPHFLFNSLNTLMSIVDDDKELAKRFLKKLSKVYRYILESREDPLILLEEEMEFISSYVFLQQERFRGNLRVSFHIPDQYYRYHIVPLSLQILFENAIKHNIISTRRPLHIEVRVEQAPERLVIRNNLQRKSQVIHSTKVGLENLRKRYGFLTQQSIRIEETEAHFTVSIPLIVNAKVALNESVDY